MSNTKSRYSPRTRVLRLYSRRWSILNVLVWGFLVYWFAAEAVHFSHETKGTLSGIEASEAEQVRKVLVEEFTTSLAFPTAVVWDHAGYNPALAESVWENFVNIIKDAPKVKDAREPDRFGITWRQDLKVLFLELEVDTFSDAEEVLPDVRRHMFTYNPLPFNYPYYITGGPAMFLDLNTASTYALRQAELIALPLAVVILMFVFRSLVAAVLPVLVAGFGVIITLGFLSYLSDYIHITFFVPNLVTMIGLGVGIDYSLIYLARYRREKAGGRTMQEALRVTRRTAGHTVIVSAVLVMSGFVALYAIPLTFFHSIALGGMLVVGAVAFASLTLLPALILLLGKNLEWGTVVKAEGKMSNRMQEFYRKWAHLLITRPWTCFLGGVAALLLIAYPASWIETASLRAETLPESADARQGYEKLRDELGPGWLMPSIILVTHQDGDWRFPDSDGRKQEMELIKRLEAMPNTKEVVSLTDSTASMKVKRARSNVLTQSNSQNNRNLIMLIPEADPQSQSSRNWMREIIQMLGEEEQKSGGQRTYQLGGVPAMTMSTDETIFDMLPRVIIITLITTFVLLFLFMRSIFVPLNAILLNVMCVLAAYGFMVLWFQDGYATMLGGFTRTEGLNAVVLVICFCTLFGLSMDYEVFILSAVRESWLHNRDVNKAIEEGLIKTAGVITSAAVILVSVFLCFAFVSVVETQQIGVGLSFAVMIDATLIRLILVPSSMALLGSWNWWLPFVGVPDDKPPEGESEF